MLLCVLHTALRPDSVQSPFAPPCCAASQKPSYGDLRTVFSHVRNLRRKLEKDPENPARFKTVPRSGYVFSRTPAE